MEPVKALRHLKRPSTLGAHLKMSQAESKNSAEASAVCKVLKSAKVIHGQSGLW